jgi:hypothetical protein
LWKIPVLRLNFPHHSAWEIVRLSTGIFRKYPSQTWYICIISNVCYFRYGCVTDSFLSLSITCNRFAFSLLLQSTSDSHDKNESKNEKQTKNTTLSIQYYRKIVERKSTFNTHIHTYDRPLSWLGTSISIKNNGEIKLVYSPTSPRLMKWFGHCKCYKFTCE